MKVRFNKTNKYYYALKKGFQFCFDIELKSFYIKWLDKKTRDHSIVSRQDRIEAVIYYHNLLDDFKEFQDFIHFREFESNNLYSLDYYRQNRID